jgi:hypothetical protein
MVKRDGKGLEAPELTGFSPVTVREEEDTVVDVVDLGLIPPA